MPTLLSTLFSTMFLQVYEGGGRSGIGRYGFFGIEGFFGLLVGLIVFIVLVSILFKIVGLLLPKLGVDPTWTQIIYWCMVAVVFLAFLHFFGLY
jgi:hypothetical protein